MLSLCHWLGLGMGIGIGVTLYSFMTKFYTPPHVGGRVLGFHVSCACVCLQHICKYIRPSVHLQLVSVR